ncbi:MAG: LamB/YcsF family protein [Devosia sp.]|nr:LamB/YcsF family protein [Devosia sp.]
MKLDINSDMGEGFGNYVVGDDLALLETVTSANVACGFHAGDPTIMGRTVLKAKERGVGIGAHPGLPDLVGFGRRTMAVSNGDMRDLLIYQIGALQGFAKVAGHRVTHVSYHAAFGNMALADRALADVMTAAIVAIDPSLIVFSMPDTAVEASARAAGLKTIQMFLADRAYRSDGTLVPRGQPGAVIKDLAEVKARVAHFVTSGKVRTADGGSLDMRAQSILVHSDTPGASLIARAVREAVKEAGGGIAPATELAQ